MTGGFAARSDAIAAHGKQLVNAVAPSLQEVVTASQTSLGPNVMGELCQAYAFIFNDELDKAKQLVGLLPAVVEATGDQLGKTAELYQNTDTGNAGSLEGLHQ
ncbi:type VII secretion target [Lentzea sp. NPDC042327]|uniref:type VII secretion target n=1 Tax=Lentzea sp. NPDC042327 TaxID=3154801 RepID=UPI0034009446